MMVLAGADVVLRDRVLSPGSIVIDGAHIAAIEPGTVAPAGATCVDLVGAIVVPGFVDVHVHGVEGHDVLDGEGAVLEVATRLPRFGVTAFCPTSIACAPDALDRLLGEVARLADAAPGRAARVLPAHLESNFINPEYRGAQPASCLRSPRATARPPGAGAFIGQDVLDIVAARRREVAIVTVAPEIDGGLDLVRDLTAAGHRVSIGHSGATFEETRAAIAAGVCHATHLFNRMTPLSHRAPGVPGAVLDSEAVTAELICDGFHVHPALMSVAIKAKGREGILAITDGTAGSGLPIGSRTRLGGRPIVVTDRTAELEDGTIAGSVLTMDGALRTLVRRTGVPIVDAVHMCATTPAKALGLTSRGYLAAGAIADLVILNADLTVRDTYLSGQPWRNTSSGGNV
jgi:N-acetylglucosamine-6-phosphate deacetylase